MSDTTPPVIKELFEKWAAEPLQIVLPLARTASNRQYFRVKGKTKTAIATIGPDVKENLAFVRFSQHFLEKGLPVPEIYIANLEKGIYLQEDLGATTLLSFLIQKGDNFLPDLVDMYKLVLEQLAYLQIKGGKGLDYSLCYPSDSFDQQSMMWDLNAFKYFFLRLGAIPFDEQALENDFNSFTKYLLAADCNYFMFRDFQSRNIMLKGGKPYFIDYQGGRKGALQYDVASLLFQPKAGIPYDIRKRLLDHYLEVVEQMISIDRKAFTDYYYGYVLIRRLQALGTYGIRGFHERKAYFINNLPIAIKDIRWLVEHVTLPVELPELTKVLQTIAYSKQFEPVDRSSENTSFLTIRVNSFSYKNGIPDDPSGNGGGFVFDCRCLHNPGRYEPYKKLTGRDESVIAFLEAHSNMGDFLNNIFHIVDEAVENYLERSFTSLTINFGCTGGQHRSVYAADRTAKYLEQKYNVKMVLHHVEQERKGWKN